MPLKVAWISPVVWNTEAFDSLVVDHDTKELVQALVTNQVAKERGTDLMDGKGNGLVILLHGWVILLLAILENLSCINAKNRSPGTGKTLTAGVYFLLPNRDERP